MTNKKMQWFKFYPKDFLDDEDVKAMDYEALGLYIVMLCHCWTNDSMPSDLKKMARIFNVSGHKFKKLWPQLSAKFFEKDERFFNKRILSEKSYLEKDFQQKSEIGLKGAKARWQGHNKGNAVGINQAMQEPEPEIEVDIDIKKPIVNSESKKILKTVGSGQKKPISRQTISNVSKLCNEFKAVFDTSNGIDTPNTKKLLNGLVLQRELPLDAERLLGLIIQARNAEGIRNRLAYYIKIVTDPKHAVGDSYLESSKILIRKWRSNEIDPRVRKLIND